MHSLDSHSCRRPSRSAQEGLLVETTSVLPVVDTRSSFLARHQFLIYRLFSLSGLIPIGGYVVVHLLTNATILDSPAMFQKNVNVIHSLGPALPLVEWAFIFLPMLFHATVGWGIIAGAIPNTNSYPYANNVRYTLQRGTAIIVFFFIVAHLIHLHHYGAAITKLGGQFDPEHAASSAGKALQAGLWLQVFYGVGVVATAYHFANGLWTQGITWGLWTSPQAQRRANWLSAFVGVGLTVVGLSALWGMARVDIPAAQKVEDRMEIFQKKSMGELPVGGEPVDKTAEPATK
jgi:succinate dehydrogenase / fumarate reductase, cytochrome b subunit